MSEQKGFRRDIMVLHHLSELMEKHPALPRPVVDITGEGVDVRWYLSPEYPAADHPAGAWWYWDKATLQEFQRTNLEDRIADLVDALGEELYWEKNDPSKEPWAYRLSTRWQGAKVSISCTRDYVCEKVMLEVGEHEEEVPDPTYVEAAPKVRVVVKDTITEWQCNPTIAAKVAPRFITKQKEVSL